MQYKCIQFKVNLDIIDDPFLELTIDDILNCQEYESIYKPIYGRWESIFCITNPIQYRWVPIQSQSYILVYFYYQSNYHPNINMKSINSCFNKRFHHLVHSTFIEINIECPANIPITQLCMKCHERKCDPFRYGLHSDAIHISLTHHHCSECKHLNNTSSDDIKEEIKSDQAIVHHIINLNTLTDNHYINTQPIYDAYKVSFQFQLFMHQSVMKYINPSLKIRKYELKLVMQEIEELHHKHSMVLIHSWMDRKGFINCYCNQLKRDHKERIWSLMKGERVNDQMHHFSFEDDEIVMERIVNLIDDGKVSPDEWMESIKELKVSLFDPIDMIKKLVQNKYPFTKKLKQKKFLKNLKMGGKWNRAIKAVQKRDCESMVCRKNSLCFANTSETILTQLLDENGYSNRYWTERQLQKNRYYNNKDGTPDVLYMLNKPLVLNINGERKIIYWIDFKNWCCWITTKMRYKLWQQNDKYLNMYSKIVIYGFMRQYMNIYNNNVPQGIIDEIECICHLYHAHVTPGMFVFSLGYVENINIGNDVVIVSLLWLQNNIPNIKKTSTKKATRSKNLTLEMKENYQRLYQEEDYLYNDYTKLLPPAYRDDYGAMYPLYAKRG